MMDNDNENFSSLVSQLNVDERSDLLKKMQKGSSVESSEAILKKDLGVDFEEPKISLTQKLNREPSIKKFWFWIKAAFLNVSVEDVYNSTILTQIAKGIEKDCPGIIFYNRKSLTNGMYDKIAQLHNARQFFRSYIQSYEEDKGGFYVFLGSLLCPQIGDQIEKEVDPYQYPFTKNLTNEMRSSLIAKMENIISDMPSSRKAALYAAIKGVDWLRAFDKLPFEKLLSKFVLSEDGKECLFSQARSDFTEISKVLCNYVPVTDEGIQALYMFHEKQRSVDMDASFEEVTDSTKGKEFMDLAANEIGFINMFIGSVPVKNLTKVVLDDSTFIPDSLPGSESWFTMYKAKWRSVFDQRWNQWNRDYKKEKLKIKLNAFFGLSNFPLFPFRPWAMKWLGVTFNYELTLGFMYYFCKVEVAKYLKILKLITLEGNFSLKENRKEYQDAVNDLNHVCEDLDILANQLSAGGEFGLEFAKLDGKPVKSSGTDRLRVVITEIERSTSSILKNFGKVCRSFDNVLSSITGDKVSSYYGTLSNVMEIGGRENKEFREGLVKCHRSFENAFEMIKEVEPLDSSTGA